MAIWQYTGYITVSEAGSPPRQEFVVNQPFILPPENVKIIQEFVYKYRDLILMYKYSPMSGEVPWGATDHQSLMSELNRLQPSEDYLVGITDSQTEFLLTAYRQELINNVDLYYPVDLEKPLVTIEQQRLK